MKKLILATNNLGKIKEFNQLTDHQFMLITLSELNITQAEETGLSFVENAIIKARHASKQAMLPAIADDSGLVVDCLQGQPGIYSARYSGQHGNDARNVEKILNQLEGVPTQTRTARFWCAMAWVKDADDPTPIIAQASWEGLIATDTHGDNGFGYDPIFYVPTHRCTAAELTAEVKNTLSHRAKALKKLLHLDQ